MAAPDNDPASRLFVVGVNQRSASVLLCERLFAEEIEPSALLARLRAARDAGGEAGAVAEAVSHGDQAGVDCQYLAQQKFPAAASGAGLNRGREVLAAIFVNDFGHPVEVLLRW